MKRASRTVHMQLVPRVVAPTEPVSEERVTYPSRTRAEVARLYPKSDPAEVAKWQDTATAREHGICAAWNEGTALVVVLGKLAG